jgi:hypothetical protein
MVRSVKKPGKKICTLCKKYRIKVTLKRGGKRVYKKESVIKRQLKRKLKGRSKFGSSCQSGYNPMSLFGRRHYRGVKRTTRKRRTTKRRTSRRRTTRKRTTRRRSGFGKTTQVRKLHKLCKVYGVKIGRKSPSVLRKQCLKKAKAMLKKVGRHSRFSRFGSRKLRFGLLGVSLNPLERLGLKKSSAQKEKEARMVQDAKDRDEERKRRAIREANEAEERKERRAREAEERKENRAREIEERKERRAREIAAQELREQREHEKELAKLNAVAQAAAAAKLGSPVTSSIPITNMFGKRRRRGRPGRPRKVGRPRKGGRR